MSLHVSKSAALVFAGLLLTANNARSQDTPPIGGVTGTIATEGAMKAFYAGAKKIVVTTADGIDHVYEFTKDLIVHGGKHPGPDALAGLRDGTTVIVHYTTSGAAQSAREIDVVGDEGVKTTEGTVEHVDRRRHEMTVRYDNGTRETLRLTDRAAAEADRNPAAAIASGKIVVYYTDESGKKVVHYFKRVS